MAIVDYSFRNEKLFDFSQIEIDKINKASLTFKDVNKTGITSPPAFRLNKNILSQLDSFSIEEKLNLSIVAFDRNDFSCLEFSSGVKQPKPKNRFRDRTRSAKKSERSGLS